MITNLLNIYINGYKGKFSMYKCKNEHICVEYNSRLIPRKGGRKLTDICELVGCSFKEYEEYCDEDYELQINPRDTGDCESRWTEDSIVYYMKDELSLFVSRIILKYEMISEESSSV